MTEYDSTPGKESAPKYRKSAQWFAFAVVILLSLVLMIDTFRRAGRDDEKPQPLPVDEQIQDRQSELDFQRRLDQEIKRRQLQNQIPLPEEQPAYGQRIENQPGTAPAQSGGGSQVNNQSVYGDWRKAEKIRALDARQAGFGLRSTRSGPKPNRLSQQIIPKANDTGGYLAREQKRIKAEIDRIKHLQQTGADGEIRQPTRLSDENRVAPAVFDDSETVGQPGSEANPKPGQKLLPHGTIITGVLDQELMSDYTGPFRGLVSHDVYDLQKRHILIPKGSRIVGNSLRITNVNEPIQARMGLVVKYLILPNGKRISFERRASVLDQAGVPAIKDKVNYHMLAQFLGVAAYAVLSIETSRQGSGDLTDSTFEGDLGKSTREQFAPLAAKYLTLVPTITLREGTPLKIFLEDHIYVYPWSKVTSGLLRTHRSSY